MRCFDIEAFGQPPKGAIFCWKMRISCLNFEERENPERSNTEYVFLSFFLSAALPPPPLDGSEVSVTLTKRNTVSRALDTETYTILV